MLEERCIINETYIFAVSTFNLAAQISSLFILKSSGINLKLFLHVKIYVWKHVY